MSRAIRVLLLVSIAACAELPDLGVCGNGIVEADLGEACDGGERCTPSCEIACLEGTCADGQTCGSDDVCRAPSGLFAPASIPQPFDMTYLRAGDFDADGIVDLVGTNATQIGVLYGSRTTALLTPPFMQELPSAYSPPVLYERETTSADASSLAIAIPTDGIALLLSDTEKFQPRIDGSFVIDPSERAMAVVTDPDPVLGDVVLEITRPSQGFAPIHVRRAELPGAVVAHDLGTCSDSGSLPGRLIDWAVSRDRRSLFLAVGINNANAWLVCEYRDLQAPKVTRVISPVPAALVTANVDGDACEEIVVARDMAMVTQVAMLDPAGADCTLPTSVTLLDATTLGGLRTELLTAGPILGNRDALVFANGAYRVTAGNELERLTPPMMPLRWLDATVTDLDRDGFGDVVAAIRNQQNVEVVRGGPSAPSMYVVTTAVGVAGLRAGDFDGDGYGDAALVETTGSAQRISILYGRPDGQVASPRSASRFQGTLAFAVLRRFGWGNTARGRDGIDDLFVVRTVRDSATMTSETTAGVMIGDASRALTMPRFPAPQRASVGTLAVGRIEGTAVSAVAVRAISTTASELVAYDLESTFATVPLDGFAVDQTRPGAVLRTEGAPLVAVIAQSSVRAFDRTGLQCTVSVPGTITGVHPVDLDDDGLDELAVFQAAEPRGRVRVYDVTGGAACSIGGELLADALDGCFDVARVSATTVTICRQAAPFGPGLYRVVDGEREPTPVTELDGAPQIIAPGDYDGDGVIDLVIQGQRSGLNSGLGSVQLARQCPAHDTRGCR